MARASLLVVLLAMLAPRGVRADTSRRASFAVSASVAAVSRVEVDAERHRWRWVTNAPRQADPPSVVIVGDDGVERSTVFSGRPGMWIPLPAR